MKTAARLGAGTRRLLAKHCPCMRTRRYQCGLDRTLSLSPTSVGSFSQEAWTRLILSRLIACRERGEAREARGSRGPGDVRATKQNSRWTFPRSTHCLASATSHRRSQSSLQLIDQSARHDTRRPDEFLPPHQPHRLQQMARHLILQQHD